MLELIGSLGCGSMIVEMALALSGLAHRVTDIPYLVDGPERQRLLSLNPLGQVPTLVLADGAVMTESAAMLLYLHDLAPEAGLCVAAGDARRAGFLNLLVQLVAAVYPTFTYGDMPERWTLAGEASGRLKETTDQAREAFWLRLEALLAPAPFALGARITAIDLYLIAMLRWRPGRAWFEVHAPKLLAAADRAAVVPLLAPIAARHLDS